MENGTTEKLTVNLNVIDLGYIDLLVSEGFYSNRTDFIKTAVRNQLNTHASDTKTLLTQKNKSSELNIGIISLTKATLEKLKSNNKLIKLVVIGMLHIPKDVNIELLQETVESLKVYGVCKCDNKIKEFYSL